MSDYCTACEHPEHLGRCDHPITEENAPGHPTFGSDIVGTCSCTHIGKRTIPGGPDVRRFVCAVCKLEYISDPNVSEEEKVAEYEEVHDRPYHPGRASSVCDQCYPKVVAWAQERGLMP